MFCGTGEVDLALKIYSEALFFVETVADLLSSLVYTKHHAIMYVSILFTFWLHLLFLVLDFTSLRRNFAIASCLEQAKKHGEALRCFEISVLKSGALLNMKETAQDRRQPRTGKIC